MTAHLSTVDAVLEYEVKQPTHFCFNLEAAHWPGQEIRRECLAVSSGLAVHRFADERSGNRFVRFDAAPGPLIVSYAAQVQVQGAPWDPELPELPVAQVPDAVFRFLLPSRYCESDLLVGAADRLFGRLPPGIARVRRIVDWVHDAVAYQAGSTGPTTSARDVFVQRKDVCRDFAHLAIALCRALNVPARLVAGYVWFEEPPQDFHAVLEAWVGGRWVLFDPSGMAPVDRLVRIGTGADAKDVAFATYFGEARMTRKEVRVREHDPRPPRGRQPSAPPWDLSEA